MFRINGEKEVRRENHGEVRDQGNTWVGLGHWLLDILGVRKKKGKLLGHDM